MTRITISHECFVRAQINENKVEIVFIPTEEIRQFFGSDNIEEMTLGFETKNPEDAAYSINKYVKDGHDLVLEAEGKLL